MYRRIYASVSVGRLHLLRDALATLEVDGDHGLAWIALPAGALEKYARATRRSSTDWRSIRARWRERGWRCSSAISDTAK